MSSYSYEEEKTVEIPQIAVQFVPGIPNDVTEANAHTISPQDNHEKIEAKIKPVQYYVKASFMITYILLLTTTVVTFTEAIRTKTPEVRHILNLETCISIVAGYFYSIFLTQIEGFNKDNVPVDWSDISKTRYVDWSITTPLMLLTLCIVLGQHVGKKVDLSILVTVIGLNYIMLYIGYLGEVKTLSTWMASFVGFIPFIAMFYIIYKNYVKPKYSFANYVLYGIYVFIWGLYGIVYLLKDDYKNITMNILDCIAKCLIGLGLWAYYSNIIVMQ